MSLIESIDALVAEQEILNEGLEVDNAIDAVKNLSLVLGHAALVLRNVAGKDKVGSATSTTTSLRQIDLAVDRARKALKVLFKSDLVIGPAAKKALIDIADTVDRQSEKITKGGTNSPSIIASIQGDNAEEDTSNEETEVAEKPSNEPEFEDFDSEEDAP